MKIANESQLLATIATALPPVRRALAFAPHPDDEIFGCGGTLALMQAAGVEVQVHILTDGALGGDSNDDTLVARREVESCTAARILGLAAPQFWRLPDRGLCYGEPLVNRLVDAIAGADADLVLLPAVTELHPDHQTLALAGAEALRRLGGERQAAFYEIGNALSSPNLLMDISSVAERKQQAMEAFASQLVLQPYAERISGLNRYRAHLLAREAHSAEAFLLTSAQELAGGFERLIEGAVSYRHRLGYVADPADLPLVSVIVRSMDRNSLGAALDSIACQTYPHIEVIVVNAKGANHRPLGSHCGHFPLQLVGVDNPLERSRAANVGLNHAKGDYLIFLDDDDRFYPHHIYSLVEGFRGDERVVAVYSSVKMVDENDNELGILEEDFDLTHLRLQNYIPIHALMFKKHVVDAGVRFDETLDVCEDWDFWLGLTKYGQFKHLCNVSAIYLINDNTGSGVRTNKTNTHNAMTKIYRKWLTQWDDATLWSVLDYARNKKKLDEYEKSLKEHGFSGICLDHYFDDAKRIKKMSDGLQQDVSKLQQEVAGSRQEIINLQQELDRLQQDLVGLQQVRSKLQQENSELQQENSELQKLVMFVKDENTIIRKDYADIVSSKSWKITYPLRYFCGIIRKIIG